MHLTVNGGYSQLHSVESNAVAIVLLYVYLICALTCKKSVKWPARPRVCVRAR